MLPNEQEVFQYGVESDYMYVPDIPWKVEESIYPGHKHITQKLIDGDEVSAKEKELNPEIMRMWEKRLQNIKKLTMVPPKSEWKNNVKVATIEDFERQMANEPLDEEGKARLDELVKAHKNAKYH